MGPGKPAAANLRYALETGATRGNLFPYFLGIRTLREEVHTAREFSQVLNMAVFTEIPLLHFLSGQKKISVMLHLYP